MSADQRLHIGIDVGSTTVKCVVVVPGSARILWSRYRRHETRQAEKVAEMLAEIEADFPDVARDDIRTYVTGSGAGAIAEHVGSRFVQEVNAVTLAVEKLHPDADSVVELGGQDAKIITFTRDPRTGARRVSASMNDKCASGTGATIDKCLLKLGVSWDELAAIRFDSGRLHRIAAKCGVFAETDIVNLIKSSVPADELLNSLANAIVMQNLAVLARGNTLKEKVLLLGGPNTFLPMLQHCWRLRIAESWAERGHVPAEAPLEELIFVPENAQYYAACGAAIFGIGEPEDCGRYRGLESLNAFIGHGRKAQLGPAAGPGLLQPGEDLAAFARRYRTADFAPARFEPGTTIRGHIGFDGGSTSSKAVLVDDAGTILAKQYLISKGNPIEDAKQILTGIRDFAHDQGCALEILGFGVTGYAADVLDSTLDCDANIVETVAHMRSATESFGDDIDVICDVGGQDIKVLFLQNGHIKNFRLSNQCSAGNGMLLQAMADQFGVEVRDYADIAFKAELSPRFSYGCAVFLDTNRVNFQKEGFSREELFAGLAMVLPKNIWQYVVQIPRMAELGRRFVLQGGTQHNLAAVKAQVDYIRERVPDAEIHVHPHCGEAGAIGAALEARAAVARRGGSTFIGLDRAIGLDYAVRTDESTRCRFCANNCARSFIDTRTPDGESSRYIAGFSCEMGTVESKEAIVRLNQERKARKAAYPNLVQYEADLVFRHVYERVSPPKVGTVIDDVAVRRGWFGIGPIRREAFRRPIERSPAAAQQRRRDLRIGIPRVLNVYSFAPFLRAYLEALGVPSGNIVFSDVTSEQLWREGCKYGSIDPCHPSKVALAHIHNLLTRKHRRKPLDYVWFPCFTEMPTYVSHAAGNAVCPVVAGTPKVTFAAFTKERDLFADAGVDYVSDVVNLDIPHLLRRQLFETWGARLGVTEDESDWACAQGWQAMQLCDEELQRRGLEVLGKAERDNELVLLMLGRPYHNDPGLNHDVLEEFEALGYPVLSLRSIPKDAAYLEAYFAEDLRSGAIADVFDMRDVWPENYSVNSVQKVWAAKFAARHPNVVVLDLSSFKCGQDAPTYGLIDRVLAASRTPGLMLHDLDANKPVGSIKLRVKTFVHGLSLYKDALVETAAKRGELECALAAKRDELTARYRQRLAAAERALAPDTRHALAASFEDYLNRAALELDVPPHACAQPAAGRTQDVAIEANLAAGVAAGHGRATAERIDGHA